VTWLTAAEVDSWLYVVTVDDFGSLVDRISSGDACQPGMVEYQVMARLLKTGANMRMMSLPTR